MVCNNYSLPPFLKAAINNMQIQCLWALGFEFHTILHVMKYYFDFFTQSFKNGKPVLNSGRTYLGPLAKSAINEWFQSLYTDAPHPAPEESRKDEEGKLLAHSGHWESLWEVGRMNNSGSLEPDPLPEDHFGLAQPVWAVASDQLSPLSPLPGLYSPLSWAEV